MIKTVKQPLRVLAVFRVQCANTLCQAILEYEIADVTAMPFATGLGAKSGRKIITCPHCNTQALHFATNALTEVVE